jgi:RecA-family ATPase
MTKRPKSKSKKKVRHMASSVTTPVPILETEYRPTELPPTTDKEWAHAKFNKPTPFLGDMLFHSHTIGMFTMKTDAGKSNWAIALALALAYGKPFCDWSPSKRARVLYIEGESPKYPPKI